VGSAGDLISPVSERLLFETEFSEENGFQQAKQAVFRTQYSIAADSGFLTTVLCLHQVT